MLVYISLAITLNQVHEDVDGSTSLVTENLTRCYVIGSHNVRWLVFLHFAELSTSFLEFAVENVEEGSVEAHKHLDDYRFIIMTGLVGHLAPFAIQEVVYFATRDLLTVSSVLVKQSADRVKHLLSFGPSSSL